MDELEKLAPEGYVKPKDWEELNDSERIDRLREVIKNLQRQVGISQINIRKMTDNFKNHSHLDGKIVISYNEYSGNTCVDETNSSSNYF